jgi:hypothetical protein
VGRACGTPGRGKKRVQGFGGKARKKKLLGRPRSSWEDGIKMDLREMGWGVWSGFSWLRIGTVAGSCVCGDEPSVSGATEFVFFLLPKGPTAEHSLCRSILLSYQRQAITTGYKRCNA